MGARRVVVRILGVASMANGFAFALTEGPRRLVTWGERRPDGSKTLATLERLLKASRPLFVAFDRVAVKKKRFRGRLFAVHLERACQSQGVMLLTADSSNAIDHVRARTKWDMASALVTDFRELSHLLPARRKSWKTEDERIGIFMALATAVAAWKELGGHGKAA